MSEEKTKDMRCRRVYAGRADGKITVMIRWTYTNGFERLMCRCIIVFTSNLFRLCTQMWLYVNNLYGTCRTKQCKLFINKYRVCVSMTMMTHAIVFVQTASTFCLHSKNWSKNIQWKGTERKKKTVQKNRGLEHCSKKLYRMQSDFTSLKYLLLRVCQ